jgi:hypothetical protein
MSSSVFYVGKHRGSYVGKHRANRFGDWTVNYIPQRCADSGLALYMLMSS